MSGGEVERRVVDDGLLGWKGSRRMKLIDETVSVLSRVVKLDRLFLFIVRYRSSKLLGRGGPT
jgi:hypothetical protein